MNVANHGQQDALLPPMPCVCILSSKLELVEDALVSLANEAKDLPPHAHILPSLDIDVFVASCQLKVNSGVLAGAMWRPPSQWHVKVRKVAEVFEEVFQSVTATFDIKSIENDYPQVANFVGGISTLEVAHRLALHVAPDTDRFCTATVLEAGFRSQDICGWSAFIAANAPRYFSNPLDEVDEMEKVELAVKSLRSGLKLAQEGEHRLAIRDYSAAAIWASSSLNRDNMRVLPSTVHSLSLTLLTGSFRSTSGFLTRATSLRRMHSTSSFEFSELEADYSLADGANQLRIRLWRSPTLQTTLSFSTVEPKASSR